MAIIQIIKFRTRAGTANDFAAGFLPIVTRVRAEPGCEQYELFYSVEEPDCLLMLERWSDEEALKSALARLYPGKDHPSLAFFKLLEGAPEKVVHHV